MSGTSDVSRPRQSVFQESGLAKTVEAVCDEIRELYLADAIPWVVGYSGGKDSSATLQLVWLAIRKLPAAERTKPIHVISTDTLVEQPLVARWVETSLDRMRNAAREQEMPIQPHKLTPEVADSFWVNLIGRGYPAPSQKFRWCTERLKIKPSNKFIRGVVQKYGEAILVLGTRKAESQRRAANIEKHAARRVRERLVPNASLPNSLVYTPIEDWNNDDVWLYLMQVKNPWGHDNKSLLGMYQGATEGGECPLVVDSSTPSCGSSRFGCWVCTVVDKDRSMEAMIKNDEEKVWMTPLLELRNELDEPDRDKRDFRRMNGHVQLFHDRTVPGPYKKEAREHWLRRVLEAQQSARQNGPAEFREIQLITLDELTRDPPALAAREARVRRQPAADLRGGDRRAVPQAAGGRQRPPGRRLGAAPGGLRGRRRALRPSGRPARRRAAVPRHDPAGRRHRCPGEMPQGGDLSRTRRKPSRSSRNGTSVSRS